jgi:hypothetical protein
LLDADAKPIKRKPKEGEEAAAAPGDDKKPKRPEKAEKDK